jgi:hypothetical protein
MIQPKNTTLVIVGMIDVEETLDFAEKMFKSWKTVRSAGPIPDKMRPPFEPARSNRVAVLDSPEATQTTIHMRCTLPATAYDQHANLEVLQLIVSDALRTRLRDSAGRGAPNGTTASVEDHEFDGNKLHYVITGLPLEDIEAVRVSTYVYGSGCDSSFDDDAFTWDWFYCPDGSA